MIRTRRVPFFKSRPSWPMLLVPTGAAIVGVTLPYTGLAHLLGFTPLPTAFFLLLLAMVVVYLLLVELAKTRFTGRRTCNRPGLPPPMRSDFSGGSGVGFRGSCTLSPRSGRQRWVNEGSSRRCPSVRRHV